MIPAPEAWARVDAPKPPRRAMDVVVELASGERVAYRRAYRASMDAYGQALQTYPDCNRITVTPAAREVPCAD
ncbi:MAG: hypothetical protein ACK44A_05455 [Roseateles sp.]